MTDYYEVEGKSLLGREINVNDYPYMKSVYGLLKLASEQAGFLFTQHRSMSCINLRIGSVPPEEETIAIKKHPRLKKTLLTDKDVIGLFTAAIESNITYGTYYGVSDNEEKPWDTTNVLEELKYKSVSNVDDILQEQIETTNFSE